MEGQGSSSFRPAGLLRVSAAVPFSMLFCLVLFPWGLGNSSTAWVTLLRFTPGLRGPPLPSGSAAPARNQSSSEGATLPGGTTSSGVEHQRLSAEGGRGFAFTFTPGAADTVSGDAHSRGRAVPPAEAPGAVREQKMADTHLEVAASSSDESAGAAGKRRDHDLLEGSFRRGSSLNTEKIQDAGEEARESDPVAGSANSTREASSSRSDSTEAPAPYPKAKGIDMEDGAACDLSTGKWVLDELYPLYTNSSCPFIDEGFSCETNGRLDKEYTKWRWEPRGCSIPRFDPAKMLELIRGRRLVFVGDSLNRNQWESMLCLLSAATGPGRVHEARGRKITKEKGNYNFYFADYRCSVEYYVTHFLVHESKARIGTKRKPTLRIDAVGRGSSRWRGADILVFNTAHWWSHYKTRAGMNYFQEGERVHPHLDVMAAFRRALTTWASWVDKFVNPRKTRVFFRTSSPAHFRGGEWNSGGHCAEGIRPLNETVAGTRRTPQMNVIVGEVTRQMRTPVTLLDITAMSGLRIDGHPSKYGRNPSKGPPKNGQDCSHWCLPGVPDAWNQLLYFHLLSGSDAPSVRRNH